MTSENVGKKRLSIDYIISQLRLFYRAKRTLSFNPFCQEKKLKRSNLNKIWKASGLDEMKDNNVDVNKAMKSLKSYLETRNLRHSVKMTKLHKSNEVMTGDEVNLVINLAKILGSMGHGIDTSICLGTINSVLRTRLPSANYISVTSSVVERMLKIHSDVVRLVHGNSIYPAQIRQVDEEVRDIQFYKVESYFALLYKMGKVPWKTYKDVPKGNIYNANEYSTNTYDHRKKTIGLASKFGRAFQITPGGDGRMPFHITNMITSCASGIYAVPIEGVEGAPPPMSIHACSGSPEKTNPTDLQSSSKSFYQNPSYS